MPWILFRNRKTFANEVRKQALREIWTIWFCRFVTANLFSWCPGVDGIDEFRFLELRCKLGVGHGAELQRLAVDSWEKETEDIISWRDPAGDVSRAWMRHSWHLAWHATCSGLVTLLARKCTQSLASPHSPRPQALRPHALRSHIQIGSSVFATLPPRDLCLLRRDRCIEIVCMMLHLVWGASIFSSFSSSSFVTPTPSN